MSLIFQRIDNLEKRVGLVKRQAVHLVELASAEFGIELPGLQPGEFAGEVFPLVRLGQR